MGSSEEGKWDIRLTAGEKSNVVSRLCIIFSAKRGKKKRSGAANSSSAQGYVRGHGQSCGGI